MAKVGRRDAGGATRVSLALRPTTIRAASAYVAQHHRHHKPPRGGRFAIAVVDEAGDVHGVAIVGRPVARAYDDGTTAEVVRVATDGAPNACSMLYGACWRAWKAMGGRRIVTYTLEAEAGTSLRAAGWRDEGPAGGGSWSREDRQRDERAPLVLFGVALASETGPKRRWACP